MKKLVLLVAAASALALTPSAMAQSVSLWGGYGSPDHCDNLADPVGYAQHFSDNGSNASQYSISVGKGYNDCSGATTVQSPIVGGGWLDLGVVCLGCNHGRTSEMGGFWIGTAYNSPVAPHTGVGVQGTP